jgi:hypothetical protein
MSEPFELSADAKQAIEAQVVKLMREITDAVALQMWMVTTQSNRAFTQAQADIGPNFGPLPQPPQ